ncbi:sensor histidine kinase [Streptomyces sp. 35G-GA-8]|uniref:sensor histidine kinase n=1 Tax=Streptomyces sp. 35G-GA-8 TaxID=2939434 RepID=UPI00201EF458|nr:histidine kinase [Streptomyces sp. 35G-GA-8]MCL7379716.1 histidine kinase [Streptomyces sp. 35G-GA-8]
MSRLTGWWNGRGGPARSNMVKVELYTRWTFHALAGLEVGAIGVPQLLDGAGGEVGGQLGGWLFLLVVTHAVLCGVLLSMAMDWRLGRREQPLRLILSVSALTGGGIIILLALRNTNSIPQDQGYAFLLMGIAGFGLAAIALGLRTAAHRVYAVLGTAAGTAVMSLVVGLEWNNAVANAAGVTATSAALAFTYVFSAWLVSVVWELDEARELHTRLAIAEERLRFGRDLHDVMGRNLAVIALKSELAVQLAERDRPGAVTQMTEVQQLAQESQREVREVVRGYREADLHTELEGARGVLKAAGIDCRIKGGDVEGLSAEIQSALGWVVREATTNVLRHGDARRCTVRLSQTGESGSLASGSSAFGSSASGSLAGCHGSGSGSGGREAVLTVENDGVSDVGADGLAGKGAGLARRGSGLSGKGSGLAGLRERLAALDGTLEAGSTADGCFVLTARVPLPRTVTEHTGPADPADHAEPSGNTGHPGHTGHVRPVDDEVGETGETETGEEVTV